MNILSLNLFYLATYLVIIQPLFRVGREVVRSFYRGIFLVIAWPPFTVILTLFVTISHFGKLSFFRQFSPQANKTYPFGKLWFFQPVFPPSKWTLSPPLQTFIFIIFSLYRYFMGTSTSLHFRPKVSHLALNKVFRSPSPWNAAAAAPDDDLPLERHLIHLLDIAGKASPPVLSAVCTFCQHSII